ncbi:MAG: hypothetical protein ACE1ZG_00020 [Gammaproteobacteria bacterium]
MGTIKHRGSFSMTHYGAPDSGIAIWVTVNSKYKTMSYIIDLIVAVQ